MVVIFGPPAVGKMTVGLEIVRLTGFKLLHNNMALDLVREFFPRGSAGFALYPEFNTRIIQMAAESGGPDLVFTYAWTLDDPGDRELIDYRAAMVEATGGEVYFVELYASLDTRLERNRSPDRLRTKPKQALELTDAVMHELDAYTMNSAGQMDLANYLYIDTTTVLPAEAARQIVAEFGL